MIFLRNVDVQTNEWASKVLSDRLEVSVGTSVASKTTTSSSSAYAPRVRPGDFMSLTQPEPEVADYAEAITLITSRAEVILERSRWPLHLLK